MNPDSSSSPTASGNRPGSGCVVALVVGIGLLVAGVFWLPRVYESVREQARAPLPLRPPALDFVAAHELAALPLAREFAYPLGSPRGVLSYNAQPFMENHHLGDDWNGIGGYNSDLGDPVHAIGGGLVTFAAQLGGGWGGVAIVQHRVAGPGGGERFVQSLYAHLDEIHVTPGELVGRGERLGTVGNAGGRYWAHLHLEVREFETRYIGAGYRPRPSGWLDPTEFIDSRLVAPSHLQIPPQTH